MSAQGRGGKKKSDAKRELCVYVARRTVSMGLGLVCLAWLTGCSVHKAATKNGASFSSLGMPVVERDPPKQGKRAEAEIERLYAWIERTSSRPHRDKKVPIKPKRVIENVPGSVGGLGDKSLPEKRAVKPGGQDAPSPPPQPVQPRALQNTPGHREETVQIAKRPWWAPAPRRTAAYRRLSPKERVCRSANMICRVSGRICRIAERFRDRERYQKMCERSTKDCLYAQKQCKAM